jgi:hypothetical protein
MRLGTYSTFDCPTQKQNEAFEYLQSEFEKIGGYVRKCSNSHDFGDYPSFEIDYPMHLNDIIECYGDDDCDDCKLMQEQDKFNEQANAIDDAYNKKFNEWL